MTGEQVGSRALGSVHTKDGMGRVRIEARLGADVHEVWSALTEPGRLSRWLGEFDGDLRLEGEYHSRFFSSGAEATGRVTECEPPRTFTVLTKGRHASSEQHIRATIAADGDETVLVVEQSGLPLDWLAIFAAGLQIHVEDLAAHLSGDGRCDSDARMGELVPEWEGIVVDVQQ